MLTRKRVPELMDDPQLDRELHLAALQGLERLNAASNGAKILARPIGELARKLGREHRLKVLDIACGAGDLPIQLSQHLRHAGLQAEIHGLDVSELAVTYATRKNSEAGANCQFGQLDVIAEDLPDGYDVIVTSLFTHHLDPPQIKLLLAKMAKHTNHMVLVNDLERSRTSLFSVTLATRVLTRSPVVRHDGPASVRAAFTRQEMLDMARKAGLARAQVEAHWPCRILLKWQKDTNAN